MLFIGHDWAQSHHDICIENDDGTVLAEQRFPESVVGLRELHELIGTYVTDHDHPETVVVGSETDKGFFVTSMIAAGYQVFAINPLAASRYRSRYGTSGAKSDRADAKMLAEIVRTDRHNHRGVVVDTEEAKSLKVLTRTHQNLIWDRQRHLNVLRSNLREYFLAALDAFEDLGHKDALSVLAIAPTPEAARKLSRSKIAAALRRGGRQRNIDERAAEIQKHLRAEHLEQRGLMATALGQVTQSYVTLITSTNVQIELLEQEISAHFDKHPDAKIICSLPGLGPILGARVLAEMGDNPSRYVDAKSRRNAAGTSPVTRSSGKKLVVVRRHVSNERIGTALRLAAFAALRASPGARSFYDRQRANGKSHNQALRALANKLVGIMHVCLRDRSLYDETRAWRHFTDTQMTAVA